MANLVAMLRLPGNLKSTQWQILAGPILILLILSMMVLPLPAFILDLLFTFNIALSIMVLLVAMFTQRTLEFAAFPTILLFTTLLRLALNVASTRIILMEGHTGSAAAPVCPSIRMIRVEATLSARRSNVVNSRMVGKAANSSVRWVNIATSSTMIDNAILKVKSRSRINAGSGSTIIDKISKMSTGPASTCHWVDFRLLGRRSIATRLAISVLLVHKIQRFRHRKILRFNRSLSA
jgi:hypothetical protein